jgi:dipeptidase E
MMHYHTLNADVLLANGGDALYLCHWMRQSGLVALLPSLETDWAGPSAGSIVMTPRVGMDFVGRKPPITGDDAALGVDDGLVEVVSEGRWKRFGSRSLVG